MALCAWNYLMGRNDLLIFYERALLIILDCNYEIEWSTTLFNNDFTYHNINLKNLVRQLILTKADLDEVKIIKANQMYNLALRKYHDHLMKGVSRNNTV